MKYLLIVILIISGCSAKTEREVDLKFLELINTEKFNQNERILKIIQKEVAEAGMKPRDTIVTNKAAWLINQRNLHLLSTGAFIEWTKEIEAVYRATYKEDTSKLEFTRFYANRLENGFDTLTYLKLLNSYLSVEEDLLNEHLLSVSGGWRFYNSNAHVLKTVDTITASQKYEFVVVPDYYDYKRSKVDSCKVLIYKNGNSVNVPTEIIQKANAFIIAITPNDAGSYKVRGYIVQSNRSDVTLHQNFADEFVVEKAPYR